MTYGRQGKVPKVKDRWYGDHNYRYARDFKPREFVGKPQFTIDELYISPFTHRRRYSEEGRITYVPVERNLQPTGINVLDEFLRNLSRGQSDIAAFCNRYGARTGDLDSLLFLLTGMKGFDFRQAIQLRMADELLRYTSLPVVDVARLSGFGSRTNLYFAYKRDLNTSPTERREQLQKQGDEGLYKIES